MKSDTVKIVIIVVALLVAAVVLAMQMGLLGGGNSGPANLAEFEAAVEEYEAEPPVETEPGTTSIPAPPKPR